MDAGSAPRRGRRFREPGAHAFGGGGGPAPGEAASAALVWPGERRRRWRRQRQRQRGRQRPLEGGGAEAGARPPGLRVRGGPPDWAGDPDARGAAQLR